MSPDSSGEKTRAHLKIRGRVQGVYYRASMVREAQNLGLTGWVRNCDGGSVEAVAEGTRADVESLIAWSQRGPAGARVDKVEVQWEATGDSFSGFVVRR
ncbi:MAG: acylphosphatase [Candidatus Binatia bacterium]